LKAKYHFIDQSGVIPYRVQDGLIQVLLITSVKRKRWIIPKGMVEPGLSAAESAAKEAWEEAGVTGTISKLPLDHYTYKKWGGAYWVDVFLLRVETIYEDWPEARFRTRRWLSLEKAAKIVAEIRLKQIIAQLADYLED
jgi:8-oxo-dGTP pyrophosphatase MutT (NUDIX family)